MDASKLVQTCQSRDNIQLMKKSTSDDTEHTAEQFMPIKDEQKEKWGSQIDFIFTCVGFAVGAGNICRFPYLCFRNGGGAFLIPYFMALFLCGIPLFFLEIALGQFSSSGPLHIWNICPLFRGLGYSMVIVSTIYATIYNAVMTWILYYLFKSCARRVPWASCDNNWNTRLCLLSENVSSIAPQVKGHVANNITSHFLTASKEEINLTFWNQTYPAINNASLVYNSPAMEFWRYHVLDLSSGLDHFGGMRWELFLLFVISWGMTYLCLFKGVKYMGKVTYVTATLPYIILTALLVRGLLLPGSLDGIKYYIIPEWKLLLQPRVWAEACLQIFFSVGPAWGGVITMASHNKFKNNCIRDALLVPMINCLTSFYGGFVIFSVTGFLAHLTGKTISEVGASGLALAFIAYPEAIAMMPISPLWGILFFTMLLSLAIDSQFAMFETMIGSFTETFPKLLQNRKSLFIAVLCVLEILFGFILCSKAGFYVFQLIDWYFPCLTLFLVALMECIVVSWIYGIDRFQRDICLMTGKKPHVIWKICWCYVSPAILLGMWMYNTVNFSEPYYHDYIYPRSAIGVGWCIAVLPILPIPFCIVRELLSREGTLKERILKAMKPNSSWKPKDTSIDYLYDSGSRKVYGPISLCRTRSNSDKEFEMD